MSIRRVASLVVLASIGLNAQANERVAAPSRAEALWTRTKPAAYEFTIEVASAGILDHTRATFRVANGTVTPLTALSGSDLSVYGRLNTIDKLFDALRQRLNWRERAVSYDTERGYPLSVDVLADDVMDVYLRFRVVAFTPLEAR